ncbi:hypothetical protein ABIE66_005423 [Peribacillus sp. B2I2]|jgi:hypothetical protein|uniref:hypothetical protein n=1 Tax=Peribacillus sp. B2I2 TaxID=3156468 RepID=UPI003516F091
MCEDMKLAWAGAGKLYKTIQKKKRMEELISDLIHHVGKTHVKTSNNESCISTD